MKLLYVSPECCATSALQEVMLKKVLQRTDELKESVKEIKEDIGFLKKMVAKNSPFASSQGGVARAYPQLPLRSLEDVEATEQALYDQEQQHCLVRMVG